MARGVPPERPDGAAVRPYPEGPPAPGPVRERAVPILPVDDLAEARRFYVDTLGFGVAFEASEDGRTGLLGVRRGGIEITLDCPMAGHGRDACVSLRVDDTDRYHAEWSAKTAVLRPPRDEPWGTRTFDLIDPFGNTIFVIGPLSTAADKAP